MKIEFCVGGRGPIMQDFDFMLTLASNVYAVSLEGIQLTFKSDFKCKESKLKSYVSLRRIREWEWNKCKLDSYLDTYITTKLEFKALKIN